MLYEVITEFRPLGSNKVVSVDVRVIAATNFDAEQLSNTPVLV